MHVGIYFVYHMFTPHESAVISPFWLILPVHILMDVVLFSPFFIPRICIT